MSNTYFMWTLEKLQEFWDDHISALFARKNSVYTKTEIDTKTAALEGAMAVVQSTDTATVAISSGQYVLWKGSLYTASSTIAIDDTLSLSNLTAVTGGGFNALDSARASGDTALGGRVDLVNGAMAIVATGDVAPKAISEGQYVLWGGVLHTANSAIADGATLTVSNLTAVTDGGFNALNDGLTSLNSKIETVNSGDVDNKFVWYKWGRVAYVKIFDGFYTASAGEKIGTLPAVCKPASVVDFIDAYSKKRIQIALNGDILTIEALNNTTIRGTVSYITAK